MVAAYDIGFGALLIIGGRTADRLGRKRIFLMAELPPSSYATGSAISTTARQVGGVVGVATLVAVLGDKPTLADFRHGWILVIAAVCASTLFSSRIRQHRTHHSAAVPVAASASH